MKWNNRRRTIDINSAFVRLTLCGMVGLTKSRLLLFSFFLFWWISWL